MKKFIGAASGTDLQELKKESEKDRENIKKVIICMDEELKFTKIMAWINAFCIFGICIYLILISI
jgi:hypothetical protein